MLKQGARRLFGSGPDIDAHGNAVRDVRRQQSADAALFFLADALALIVDDVLRTGNHARPAVEALHFSLFGERVDVFTNRLRRHFKMPGQLLDGRVAAGRKELLQGLMTSGSFAHVSSLCSPLLSCSSFRFNRLWGNVKGNPAGQAHKVSVW